MDESNFVGCSEERDTWRILRVFLKRKLRREVENAKGEK